MPRYPTLTGAVFAAVIALAALTGPAAAQSQPATQPPCLGTGHTIDIGSNGPTINATVHYSLFTNLYDGGAVGFTGVGDTSYGEIVDLRTGVRFAGLDDSQAFLDDPFNPFSLVFDYTLSLPMLSGAPGPSTYSEDAAPVTGVDTCNTP